MTWRHAGSAVTDAGSLCTSTSTVVPAQHSGGQARGPMPLDRRFDPHREEIASPGQPVATAQRTESQALRSFVNAEGQPHIQGRFQNIRMNRYWKSAVFMTASAIAGSLALYLSLEWLGFRLSETRAPFAAPRQGRHQVTWPNQKTGMPGLGPAVNYVSRITLAASCTAARKMRAVRNNLTLLALSPEEC
jgi:hypothetical protein